MDVKNQRLLGELLTNARQSHAQLGRKLRISREQVAYRIKRLLEEKVILSFVTTINTQALGFQHFGVYIQADNLTQETEQRITAYLSKNKYAAWLATSTGRWNFILDIYATSTLHLNELLNEFLYTFSESISDYRVLELARREVYLEKTVGLEPKDRNCSPFEKKDIDKTDKRILKCLSNDARATYVDIARSLRLTANAVKHRIKNLEKTGIILGYTLELGYRHFGEEWHTLQIKLARPSKAVEEKAKTYFSSDKNTIYVYHYLKTGEYDFDVGIRVKDSEELRAYVNKLRRTFYQELILINSFIILEQVTGQGIPSVLFS